MRPLAWFSPKLRKSRLRKFKFSDQDTLAMEVNKSRKIIVIVSAAVVGLMSGCAHQTKNVNTWTTTGDTRRAPYRDIHVGIVFNFDDQDLHTDAQILRSSRHPSVPTPTFRTRWSEKRSHHRGVEAQRTRKNHHEGTKTRRHEGTKRNFARKARKQKVLRVFCVFVVRV